MLQRSRGDGESLLRVPDHQISVVPNSDRSLSRLQRDLPRRISTEPLRKLQYSEPAAARFGPNDWQPELKRRNAAPGFHKITTLSQLHLSRTRRVVRDNKTYRSIREAPPQLFTILTLTNRRTTLKLRG